MTKICIHLTLLLVLLSMFACDLNRIPQPSFTFTPAPVGSMTFENTPYPTKVAAWVSPTMPPPQPTLTLNLQDQFYNLLETNGNCELPCFLGITPGQTSFTDARGVIETYTGSFHFLPYDLDAGRRGYAVMLDTTKDINLHFTIEMEVIESDVRGMEISGEASRGAYAVTTDKHLARYSLIELFQRNGDPEFIYLTPPGTYNTMLGYDLSIFYQQQKIAMFVSGSATQNADGTYRLCPNLGDGDIVSMHLTVGDPEDTSVNMLSYAWDFVRASEPVGYPTERQMQLDVDKIYRMFVKENIYCFNYDRENPNSIIP